MSVNAPNAPAVGCACVVQLVPSQRWSQVWPAAFGSWYPAAKQLVLLTHEMSCASPEPVAGGARAMIGQVLPFGRSENGCGLPSGIGYSPTAKQHVALVQDTSD